MDGANETIDVLLGRERQLELDQDRTTDRLDERAGRRDRILRIAVEVRERARDLDLDGIEIERRDLGDKRFDDGARTSALRENGPAADNHDRLAVGRQGGVEMLADGIRLVWLREILTRIADLLDDPAEIRFALTIGVSGHLAKELRRRRHPRTASDPHIEAAIEEELLDFGSILVMSHLAVADGHRLRFSAMKGSIEGITQRMLTLTLRNLERDGLLSHHYFPEVPPRVEYELTAMGASMLPALEGFTSWIKDHWPMIEVCRQTYDEGRAS